MRQWTLRMISLASLVSLPITSIVAQTPEPPSVCDPGYLSCPKNNTTELDLSNIGNRVGDNKTFVYAQGYHENGERETYDTQHVYYDNNSHALILSMTPPQGTSTDAKAASGAVFTRLPVTSMRADPSNPTAELVPIRHGILEVTAQLPKNVCGAWPAIWLLPMGTPFIFNSNQPNDPRNTNSVKWPTQGEIDLIEMAGQGIVGETRTLCKDKPTTGQTQSEFWTTIHYGKTDNHIGYVFDSQSLIAPFQYAQTQFHNYAIEWIRNGSCQATDFTDCHYQLNVYIDGLPVLSSAQQSIGFGGYPPARNCQIDSNHPVGCGNVRFSCVPGRSGDTHCLGDQVLAKGFLTPYNPPGNNLGAGFYLIMNLASGGVFFQGGNGPGGNGVTYFPDQDPTTSKPSLNMRISHVRITNFDMTPESLH